MKHLYILTLAIACFLLAMPTQAQQHCLDFDGFDDYVEIPNASATVASLNAFSMSCWVYPTNAFPSFPNFDGILGIRNELNADFFILQLSATNFEARFRNSSGTAFTINSATCQLNAWQHLALVYTGTALQFYHNGVLSQSIPASGNFTNTTLPLTIGRVNFQTTPFFLTGKVDEVGLWTRALSDTDVRCMYEQKIITPTNGLAHYYSMDQGVAGGNNFGIPQLNDDAGVLPGTFYGLAMSGTFSNFVLGTQQMAEIHDTICRGTTYQAGGQVFTQPGTYRYTLPGSEGCDSSVVLHLRIDSSLQTDVVQNREILEAQQSGASYQWLDCQNAFAAIAGATNQTFTATSNGQYAVAIGFNGCTDTSACYLVNTVGLPSQSFAALAIKIYPNPGTDFIVLEGADLALGKLTVRDLQGRLLPIAPVKQTDERVEINSSQWPAGVYLLQWQSSTAQATTRWVKTK